MAGPAREPSSSADTPTPGSNSTGTNSTGTNSTGANSTGAPPPDAGPTANPPEDFRPRPPMPMDWMGAQTEWGVRSAPGAAGLRLGDLNTGSYGDIPGHLARRHHAAARRPAPPRRPADGLRRLRQTRTLDR